MPLEEGIFYPKFMVETVTKESPANITSQFGYKYEVIRMQFDDRVYPGAIKDTVREFSESDFLKPKENPENQSMFFDIRKTLDLYHKLKGEKGQVEADKIIWKILREDLFTIGWEAIDTKETHKFNYQFIKGEDGKIKVVHESDEYNKKSILEGVNGARRGTEFVQACNFVEKVNEFYLKWKQSQETGNKLLEEGWSIFMPSPKFDPNKERDGDCYYPDTFFTWVNIKFDKNPQGEVVGVGFASQTKSNHINTSQAAEIRNYFSSQKIDNNSDLDRVITDIGFKVGEIKEEEVTSFIEKISGLPFTTAGKPLEIKEDCNVGAWLLLWALQREESVEQLEQLHSEIIFKMVKGQPTSRVHYDDIGRLILETGCSKIVGRSLLSSSISLKSLFVSNSESSSNIKCPHCGFENLTHCVKDNKCNDCSKNLKES